MNTYEIITAITGDNNPDALSFVPDGTFGDIRISTKVKRDTPYNQLMDFMDAAQSKEALGFVRYVPPGTYKVLHMDGELMMSNTPDEMADAAEFIHAARGRVLINGFGLGCTVLACMMKDEVEHVTVVERNINVLKHIVPPFMERFGDRLSVYAASAFDWTPPEGEWFDVAWHDIWPTISDTNLPDMGRLTDKYAHHPGIQQFCWCEEECLAMEETYA
jgi:hypothetical protein